MTPASIPPFLATGGELGALIAQQDWGASSLGPMQDWPSAVKTTLATWLGSPQPMFLAWGAELRFFFNAAYRPFLGERRDAAMGRPFSEVWSDIWADIEPIVARALAGQGSRFEELPLTMRRHGYDEATWWNFTYMPLHDEQGGIVGMLCTCSEATAQVLSLRQLNGERERQRLMLQQMPGFVSLMSGPNHVFDYVNDAYREISGHRELIGLSVRQVFPELEGQGFHELLDQVYRTGRPFVARARPIHLAGETAERYIDFLYHPIRDAEDRVSGIFVGGYDVTEQVRAGIELRGLNETLELRVEERTAALMRAQEALRQAQKLEAVGQLTGGVAHDFNNMLTVIGSSVELMRRAGGNEERRQKYLGAIGDTVRRASKLTGQLLAFARRQPLHPELFDVGRQLEAVADLIRPLVGARVQIVLQLCETACIAEADVNQFETALVNLAVNARDAMDGEGRLVFTIDAVDALPAMREQPARPGRFVAISVADSGSGIATEHLANIFEPFFTTKPVGKGTGLGLSQVFGFARQSGGDIDLRSEPGQGATFTLYLPRASRPLDAAGAPLALDPAAPVTGNLRVLVVEDNETVGQFSTDVLQDLGYETSWATNAAEALALLEADSLRFDLVFSDVIMPGMNGVDLARRVRDRYPGLPVVLTSGYSAVLADEGRHGFTLIQKPYSVEALSRVIQQAIEQRTAVR